MEADESKTTEARLRVMRLFSRLNIGGPSLHVVLLTAGLRSRGYETLLVVGREEKREGNLLEWARQRDVECWRIEGLGRAIRPLSDLRAGWQLFRLMRRFRPSIVHTHTAKAGLLGRVAAFLAGAPVVVHTFHGHVLRGYFGPLGTAALGLTEKLLARATSALVAVSGSVRQELVDLGIASADKIRVIPLGLELEALAAPLPRGGLRRSHGVPDDSPLVGCVGRLVPIKDLETFLHAAADVHAACPEVHFSLVGDGEQRTALEAVSRRLGLTGAVHFHGWQRDMGAVYGDLDLVVNSSVNEGTPVALIEALAAGRPVIATRVGGTPDLLANGLHGCLVPAGDPRALAAAIREALQQPEELRARARAGQQHVLRTHTTQRLCEDIDALYRELLPVGQSA